MFALLFETTSMTFSSDIPHCWRLRLRRSASLTQMCGWSIFDRFRKACT